MILYPGADTVSPSELEPRTNVILTELDWVNYVWSHGSFELPGIKLADWDLIFEGLDIASIWLLTRGFQIYCSGDWSALLLRYLKPGTLTNPTPCHPATSACQLCFVWRHWNRRRRWYLQRTVTNLTARTAKAFCGPRTRPQIVSETGKFSYIYV